MTNAIGTDKNMIGKNELINDLIKLGVKKGDLLNLKVSLKSIGHINGFANTLIEALLDVVGPKGTIVSESFIKIFPLPLSEENKNKISDSKTTSYAGALANAMIKHPLSERSTHPIQKFVAIGADAKWLTESHGPDDYAYEVLKLMLNNGGINLKIGTDEKVVGVGTTHVAIDYLGLERIKPKLGINYINSKGEIETFNYNWNGGCSEGFNKFISVYRDKGAIINEDFIGAAPSKLTNMKKTFDIEIETLSKDPKYFFCDDLACSDCRLSWPFSEGNRVEVFYYKLKNALIRRLLKNNL